MVSSIEKAVERLNKARVSEEAGEKEPTITALAEDSAKSTLVVESAGIGVDGKDESGGYAEEASYFSEVGADDDPLAASQSELVDRITSYNVCYTKLLRYRCLDELEETAS